MAENLFQCPDLGENRSWREPILAKTDLDTGLGEVFVLYPESRIRPENGRSDSREATDDDANCDLITRPSTL